jgi:hypothetical protein
MDVLAALGAGFVGGAALIGIELLLPHLSRMEIDLTRTAADALSYTPTAREALAYATPLVMGVLFGLVYAGLWARGIGRPTWGWALLFGAAHGLVIAAASPLAQRFDPEKFALLPGKRIWVVGEMLDHVVYVLVVAWVYAALTGG